MNKWVFVLFCMPLLGSAFYEIHWLWLWFYSIQRLHSSTHWRISTTTHFDSVVGISTQWRMKRSSSWFLFRWVFYLGIFSLSSVGPGDLLEPGVGLLFKMSSLMLILTGLRIFMYDTFWRNQFLSFIPPLLFHLSPLDRCQQGSSLFRYLKSQLIFSVPDASSPP